MIRPSLSPSPRVLLPLLVGVAVGACASTQVTTEYDADRSFEGLRTYAWLPNPPADIASDRPTVKRIIRTAVETELEVRGFEQDPFEPDFWINTHAVRGGTDVRTTWDFYGIGTAYWLGMWQTADVDFYQEGTLILDVIEPRTLRVMWRGIASGAVQGGSWAAIDAERVVGGAVSDMLSDFPPR